MPSGVKTLEMPIKFDTLDQLRKFTEKNVLFVIGPAYVFSEVSNSFVPSYIIYNSQGIRCADYHIVDSNHIKYSPPGVNHEITTLKYQNKANLNEPSLISFPSVLSCESIELLFNYICEYNLENNGFSRRTAVIRGKLTYILELNQKPILAFTATLNLDHFRFYPVDSLFEG